MKSFEVQMQRSGKWVTDSAYTDRGLAELRARQFDTGHDHGGVRVIEEVFVEKAQKYVTRTVYRDAKFQETVQAKIDTSRRNGAEAPSASGPRRPDKPERVYGSRRRPSSKKTKKFGGVQLLIVFALLVGIGIGALITLEYVLKTS